jgi:hypothetical protein
MTKLLEINNLISSVSFWTVREAKWLAMCIILNMCKLYGQCDVKTVVWFSVLRCIMQDTAKFNEIRSLCSPQELGMPSWCITDLNWNRNTISSDFLKYSAYCFDQLKYTTQLAALPVVVSRYNPAWVLRSDVNCQRQSLKLHVCMFGVNWQAVIINYHLLRFDLWTVFLFPWRE